MWQTVIFQQMLELLIYMQLWKRNGFVNFKKVILVPMDVHYQKNPRKRQLLSCFYFPSFLNDQTIDNAFWICWATFTIEWKMWLRKLKIVNCVGDVRSKRTTSDIFNCLNRDVHSFKNINKLWRVWLVNGVRLLNEL